MRAQDWAPDPRLHLSARLEDLDVAAHYAMDQGDVHTATSCAIALAEARRRVGPPDAAIHLGRTLLTLPGAPVDERARLRHALAIMEHKRGGAAEALAFLALGSVEDGLPSPLVRLDGLLVEARIRRETGDPQAQPLAAEALTLARQLGRPVPEAEALTVLMDLHRVAGALAEAEENGLRALALFRRAGVAEGQANALLTLGNVLGGQGRLDKALTMLHEGLDRLRGSGNPVSLAIALLNTGIMHAQRGETAAARTLLEESLELARRLANRHLEAGVLGNP